MIIEFKQNVETVKEKRLIYIFLVLVFIFQIFLIKSPMNYPDKLGIRTIHSRNITQQLSKNDFDILNTKVYCRGDQLDYVQAFPLYKILIAGSYKIFGEKEIIGRIYSTIFFILALFIFYRICLFFLTSGWTLLSLILYSFNWITISYSYQFQPTSFEVMLLSLSILLFLKHIEVPNNQKYFALFTFTLTVMLLVKITFIIIALPFLYLLLKKFSLSIFKQTRYYIALVIIFLLNFIWYYYAYNKTAEIYQITFGDYVSEFFRYLFILKDPSTLLNNYSILFANYFLPAITVLGLLLAVFGMLILFYKKINKFVLLWLLAHIILLILIPIKFRSHPYNFMSLLLPLSIIAAIGIKHLTGITFFKLKFTKSIQMTVMISLLVLLGLSSMQRVATSHRYNYDYIIPVSKHIKDLTLPEDKIIFCDQNVDSMSIWKTVHSYYTERNGFPIEFPKDFYFEQMKIPLKKANYLAIFNPKPTLYWTSTNDKHDKFLNRIFTNYPIIDSFYNHYYLFDLRLTNFEESENKNIKSLNLNLNNEITLEKIIYKKLGENEKPGLKFLWKKETNITDFKYSFIGLTEDSSTPLSFNHKLIGGFFTTDRWKPGKFYSRWIPLPEANKEKIYKYSFIASLVDRRNNKILLPNLEHNKLPVITITLSKNQLQSIDIKYIEIESMSVLKQKANEQYETFIQNKSKKAKNLREYQFYKMPFVQ